TLGSVTRGGAFSLVNNTGLTVSGPLTNGTITNAVSITANNGALTINGNISTSGSNNITLAGKGVMQATTSTINADFGMITVDGMAGIINLGSGTLRSVATGTAITIRNAMSVALGNVSAANGTVVLGVGQDISGAVTQNATTTISAATL